jgi:hypothetical protein
MYRVMPFSFYQVLRMVKQAVLLTCLDNFEIPETLNGLSLMQSRWRIKLFKIIFISKCHDTYITGLVPPAPSNLQGNLLTSNMIEIKWTAPKTKLKITGYALHYQSLGGKELIVSANYCKGLYCMCFRYL